MEEENKSQIGKWDQNINRITSMAAIFISVLSMIAVIYQSYLSREENELIRIQQSATVLPYLSGSFSENDNKFQIVLENKGVGPAFIKKVTFRAVDAENKDSLLFDNSDKVFQYMRQKSAFLQPLRLRTSTLVANMLLSQNEVKRIAEFFYEDDKQLQQIRQELQRFDVSMEVVYEDVYGTAWMYHSSKGFPEKVTAN
ncbi:MAG: hypothetical protein AAFV95_18840 [Bacteroidota bacterium]